MSVARINPIRALDFVALKGKPIQKPQLSRKPRQLVHENQSTDEQEKCAAEDLYRMQITPEALIKLQELANAESRQQEWDGEPGRVDCE
jgi:hypothetical protein